MNQLSFKISAEHAALTQEQPTRLSQVEFAQHNSVTAKDASRMAILRSDDGNADVVFGMDPGFVSKMTRNLEIVVKQTGTAKAKTATVSPDVAPKFQPH